MGRWKTITATMNMVRIYTGDVAAKMRENYRDEEQLPLTDSVHKRMVSHACELVEKAMEFNLPDEDIRSLLIYFGMTMDADKHRLNIQKFEDDYCIHGIQKEIHDEIHKKQQELRDILNQADRLIGPEEWDQIKTEFQIQKKWKQVVSDHWHRIIVGKAVNLVKTVISEGGIEEEVKLALTYLKVCIDANKYLLDYKKFKQERGVVELSEKYGIPLY